MQLNVMVKTAIHCTAIRCKIPILHGAEEVPLDFPHRNGDLVILTIDLESGMVRDWPLGREENLVATVRDEGSYYLLNGDPLFEEEVVVAKIEEDYVPDCLPGHFGDVVELQIESTGKITNWKVSAWDVKKSFFCKEAA